MSSRSGHGVAYTFVHNVVPSLHDARTGKAVAFAAFRADAYSPRSQLGSIRVHLDGVPPTVYNQIGVAGAVLPLWAKRTRHLITLQGSAKHLQSFLHI